MTDRDTTKSTVRDTVGRDSGSIEFEHGFLALDTWCSNPDAHSFPYSTVIREFHREGKHFVRMELLEKLDDIRSSPARIGGSLPARRQLQDFLKAALDKRDGRYDYTTYLAINLLGLPGEKDGGCSTEVAERRRDRLFVLLVNDLLAFELATMDGRSQLMPEQRPDARTVEKRYMWGVQALQRPLDRLGWNRQPGGHSVAAVRDLCDRIDARISGPERRLLQISMLPVYVVHDEYLFLRVLQSFELTFAWIAVYLRAALASFRSEPGEATRRIELSKSMLKEASKLFPLLATMQKESFQTFRTYTEGASAIQSRNYKTVESLCRIPDEPRLNSIAYESVPEVRERLLAGQFTLDEAYHAALQDNCFSTTQGDELRDTMQCFAANLVRWKRTHYGIAVKMLGENPGTGYTEGTPYLKKVREIPVFKLID